MSLFALPTTNADLVQLQNGLQFSSNQAQAAAQSAAINAPGSTTSVFTTAANILNANTSLSQVAMATTALMEGGTIAVGDTTTPNTLTFLTTQFLPGQVANAIANHFDPTVYAAEALGLALASNASFNTNFVSLSVSQFAQAVSTLTGVNANAIQQFVANWTAFYTANPSAHVGLSVTQAAYGAAFGDSTGVALLNPTAANLQTVFSTQQGQLPTQYSPNHVNGLVANALMDVATGQYTTGAALGALPQHTPLQGEFNNVSTGVFLTTGIDTPTSGFSNNPNGTPLLNGFTATQPGQIINALPAVSQLGIANNTLNTGDNIQDTAKDGTLNYTAAGATLGIVAANPPFANNVTMNGVSTLNATNNAVVLGFPFVAGFAGKVTGLTTVNDNNSLGTVQLGQLGQGLGTLLTNVNISGYSPQSAGIVGGTALFAGIVAQAAADATKTINVSITGPVGTTKAGGADTLIFSNDLGGGTAASPNLSYGTWALTLNSNANLTLQQDFAGFIAGAAFAPIAGGVGAATGITLAGKGNVSLGQDAVGNWRNAAKIDATGESGTVFIPGATAGVVTNSFASAANPAWLFGSAAGLLDDTGATFKLTEYDLGSGTNILDVSTATAAQIGALKTVANATPSLTNTIVVQDSVATTTSKTTFANITGFQTLGIGGPTKAQGAAGTVDLANLPASISNITYFTKANGSVIINNQTAALTVDVKDQTVAGQDLTVGKVGPAAGLNDSLTVSVGNPLHVTGVPGTTGGDFLGDITAFGDEQFTLTSLGAGAVKSGVGNGANDIGGIFLVPTAGGNEQVTIGGDTTLQMAVTHSINGAISDGTGTVAAAGVLLLNNLSVTITNTAATEWGQGLGGSLLDFATGGGPVTAYSNNAVLIDASKSGGLISPWGDANFVPGATVALSTGDTIIGATNPVGYQTGGGASLVLGNVLVGSIGNDKITSNSLSLPDYIVTEGGKDTITLAAGHTGADHVGFYSANGNVNVGAAYAVAGLANSITQSFGGLVELANTGWWGLPAGGASTSINTLFLNGTGTSADASTLTNFNAALDFLDFSAHAWGTGGIINGLSADTGVLKNVAAAGLTSATGTAVVTAAVAPGGTIAGSGADLILLNNGSFLDANAVAGALKGGAYTINHSNTGAGFQAYDFLIAWQGTDGNAHVGDLHLQGSVAGSTATNAVGEVVHVSEVANLVGVSLNALAANTTHVHVLT